MNKTNSKLQYVFSLLDLGKFQESYERVLQLREEVDSTLERDPAYYLLMFSIAGIFVDIGAMQPNNKATNLGLKILKNYQNPFLLLMDDHEYYYFLSNALTNLTKDGSIFDVTFTTIEKLIEIKSYLWKAVKSANENDAPRTSEYQVNLGISLKRQFRITEALQYFDKVNLLDLDIPQAWLNRSEALMMLNTISASFSIQMLEQVKMGYEKVIKSKEIPPQWTTSYQEKIDFITDRINQTCKEKGIKKESHNQDEKETQNEFDKLGKYRQFNLENNLTLSEHGLYCHCAGSARDDLSIMGVSISGGDEIAAMEMVLNRIKSEFSLARRNYFEYFQEDNSELFYEECYTELYNNELLGLNIEKMRTAFRLCFGILDKIAVAVCEFYDIFPSDKTKDVSFHSTLWQLDRIEGRRDKFEAIKTPGLLALYSIATDLNAHKDGELSFFKEYRNSLEHSFVVIHESDDPTDLYRSHEFFDSTIFIKEEEFIQNLELLLQLTKSAIFSFVFMVRGKSFEETEQKNKMGVKVTGKRSIIRKVKR